MTAMSDLAEGEDLLAILAETDDVDDEIGDDVSAAATILLALDYLLNICACRLPRCLHHAGLGSNRCGSGEPDIGR